MKLDLAFLSQALSFHSHLYDILLSYHLWFRQLLYLKDLSFLLHRPFLKGQVFPNHKPSLNLSPLPLSRLECLHSFLTDRCQSVQSQIVERQRGSVFIPPDLSPASRHSTGEPRPTYPMSPSPIPRPYPTDLGEVVHIPPSPSSSSGSSMDTYRRDGSRRDSRMGDS